MMVTTNMIEKRSIVASPARVANWIQDLSRDRRSCRLLGWTCVADFDITPKSIAAIAPAILDALAVPEAYFNNCQCDDINIGLYDGGRDIRVWKVYFESSAASAWWAKTMNSRSRKTSDG